MRRTVAGLAAIITVAGVGWVAAKQIRSPAQIAADTAPPEASLISVPVERRRLSAEVITRGTLRFGAPQSVSLPASSLKTGASIVTSPPQRGGEISEGEVAMSVSDRPVFVLRGTEPMSRDLGPGVQGHDVLQLEQALARGGFDPGTVDTDYDGATGAAVAAMYSAKGEIPFGITDIQAEQLRLADEAAALANDSLLQMRLALRTAQQGVTAADLNQARIDATTAGDAVPLAQIAVTAAREKASIARSTLSTASAELADAQAGLRRDVAAADAEVEVKRAAVGEARDARDQAQQDLNIATADPETTSAERLQLASVLRRANEALAAAEAELNAAIVATEGAKTSGKLAVRRALAARSGAKRDLALAHSEVRSASASVRIARQAARLAAARIRILNRPVDAALEQQIVAAAAAEARRTSAERNRLALEASVQVPADEVLFFGALPLRIDATTVRRGSPIVAKGPTSAVMTVTNSRLAIDSSVTIADSRLVKPGLPARVEEPSLGIRTRGTVKTVAIKPGTKGLDTQHTYLRVIPRSVPSNLVGSSVRLAIAVESTQAKVLAVPVSALFVVADGSSRVERDLGNGKTQAVEVVPGLSAQGFVEIELVQKGALSAGDQVIVDSSGAPGGVSPAVPSAAGDPAAIPSAPGDPAAPPAVAPTPTDPGTSTGQGGSGGP